MYSVKFSPDLVQYQVRETVSGVLLARIDMQMQILLMVEVMRRDLNEPLMTHVPITENQLGKLRMIEEVPEQMGMNYPEILDSSYVAQPVNDFPFPWVEEMGSDEDEGFSETMLQNTHRNNHQRWKPE